MSSFKMFPAIGAAYMDFLIFFEWDLKDAFQMTRRDDYPEGKELPPQFAFPPHEFQQKDEVTGERMVCKFKSFIQGAIDAITFFEQDKMILRGLLE